MASHTEGRVPEGREAKVRRQRLKEATVPEGREAKVRRQRLKEATVNGLMFVSVEYPL